MPDKISPIKKNFSLDWLLRGALAKFGETFDRLTGRNWKPSSSLATSQLIERLKLLLDSEVRDLGAKGSFVPHIITLKMQWDKFSTDAENALKILESELLTAAADHINDNRYHTFAPLKLEIKPDYFTEGVKLHAGFAKFGGEEQREAEVNVTFPDMKSADLLPNEAAVQTNEKEFFTASFTIAGTPKQVKLNFENNRRLSVGRTRENDLAIEDASVSKIHASLVLNAEKQIIVADTGSTNGTFINGQRISYGKAFPIVETDNIKFGTIDVVFRYVPKPIEEVAPIESPPENSVTIGEFEFKSKRENDAIEKEIPAPDSFEDTINLNENSKTENV